MTNTSGNSYQTATPIPAQSSPVTVFYAVKAWFQGVDAMSPTNDPVAGTNAAYSFTFQVRPYATDQKSIDITGNFPTGMTQIADYTWQGVYNATSLVSGGTFRFEGLSTNMVTTNRWGETNQTDMVLPLSGTAETNGGNIQITGSVTDQLAFVFNESNRQYTVRQCVYHDFEGWSTAGYVTDTNRGWIVRRGSITLDNTRKHHFQACYLSNGLASIQTPYLTNGIGEVSFWYRNWESNGTPTAECYVQKSRTGGTNESEWTTIVKIDNISATNYGRYATTLNDWNYYYVRIRNSTNLASQAFLCVDEFLVAAAGSGYRAANSATCPLLPDANDQVTLTIDLAPLADPTNLNLTAWYRTGTTGAFTSVSMAKSSGNTYAMTTPIPAGSGNNTNDGTGIIQYYYSGTYTGFESSAGSPFYYPYGGSNTPAFISIRPVFSTSYTNISVTGFCQTNLLLASNNTWLATASFTTNLVNAQFRYLVTNASSGAYWGEAAQPFTDMPVFGFAESNASYITMGGTQTGQFLFRFNDSLREYSAQRCQFISFDDWNTPHQNSTYTNTVGTNWVIVNARTTDTDDSDDLSRTWAGRSCFLAGTEPAAYVRSPFMTNGVGEISFWYRKWDTAAATSVTFEVQTSPNGTSSWKTVAASSNVTGNYYQNFTTTLADRSNRYARVLNSTNGASLCIDQLVVADPGPGIAYSNVVHSPSSPSIIDLVNVSADLWPISHATNFSPYAWYRLGTSGTFTATSLTNTGGATYQTQIPRIGTGQVQYYIETFFTGLRSNELVSVTYPNNPQLTLLIYTNVSTAVSTNFDDWIAGETDVSIGNWVLTTGYVDDTGNPGIIPSVHSSPVACVLDTSSTLRTPMISGGVEAISLWFSYMTFGNRQFVIEKSVNGLPPWTTVSTITTNATSWTNCTVLVGETNSVYLQIRNLDSDWLAVDDVVCSYASAKVAITNVMIHPGYPASNETVNVSCNITSINPTFPASDIRARVYYRKQGAGGFTNPPVEMSRNGNYFITTAGGIPRFPDLTTIEYFIESTFQGYSMSPARSYSPTYCPMANMGGATNQIYSFPPPTWFSYKVRQFQSDFSNLQVNVNIGASNAPVIMSQLNNYTWQGVFMMDTPTVNPTFGIVGWTPYANSNYVWGGSNSWGDSAQTRSQVPFSSIMQAGASNITMGGTNLGQYVFRFDERDSSYTVQRCVFQDFDTWNASSDFFVDSISKSGSSAISNDFSTWKTNVPAYRICDFEDGWTNRMDYPAQASDGINPWTVHFAAISNDMGGSKFVQLKDSSGIGTLRISREGIVKGLGTFDFDYRCRDDQNAATVYAAANTYSNTFVEATMWAPSIPTNQIGAVLTNMGTCSMSMYARYSNISNCYELRRTQLANGNSRIEVYRVVGGTATALGAESGLGDTSCDIAGTLTNRVRIGMATARSATAPPGEAVTVLVYVNGNLVLRLADGSASVLTTGSVAFAAIDADMCVDDVHIGECNIQAFHNWPEGNSSTNAYTNSAWVITYASSYNNGSGVLETNRPLTIYTNSNIRSPVNPNGVGWVRFYYQNPSGPWTRCNVQWSTNPAATTWNNITNFSYQGSWVLTNILVDITNQNTYVRICNVPTSSTVTVNGRLELDVIAFTPHTNTSAGSYWQNFESAGTYPPGWSDASGKWVITNYSFGSTTGKVYFCPGYTMTPISFDVQTAPISTPDADLLVESNWTTRATLSDLNHSEFRHYSTNFTLPDDYFVRIQHRNGNGFLVVDNAQLTSWHAAPVNSETNDYSKGWLATNAWTTTNGVAGTNCVEFLYSRASAGELQYLRSPPMSNGVGSVKVVYRSSVQGVPVSFDVDRAVFPDSNNWVTIYSMPSAYSNSTWYTNSILINTNSPMWVRIRSTSTNVAALMIDRAAADNYATRDLFTWVAYNALITDQQTTRLRQTGYNVQGAYLNHHPTNGADTTKINFPYTNDWPYIQSGFVTNGIGEISFWYRNWGTPYGNANVEIRAAPNENMPTTNDWITLCTIPLVSSTNFTYFTTNFYDISNHYVRIYCSTTAPAGRICLDDVLITSPYGVDLSMRNLATVPQIPLHTNPVYFTVDLYDFFLQPSNITPVLYYHVGTNNWGTFAATGGISMTMVNSNAYYRRYQTVTPIAPLNTDTVVQYFVETSFEGLFGNKASPKQRRTFTTPSWYYPTDLNNGQANPIAYYIVFNCKPGAVWINEFNIQDDVFTPIVTTQYIELAGLSGVDLNNWKLEVMSTGMATQSYYRITNNTVLASENNGYGFWVIADTNMTSGWDMRLTNALPIEGGIRLFRSMGAIEHAICYGDSANAQNMTSNPVYRFAWLGWGDEEYAASPIAFQGTGSNKTDFTWNSYTTFSPGGVNASQTLVVQNQPPLIIEISRFVFTSTNMYMVFTVENGAITPAVQYSTNLLQTNWYPVTGSTYAVSGNVYTQWFGFMTNYPSYFYRVVTN